MRFMDTNTNESQANFNSTEKKNMSIKLVSIRELYYRTYIVYRFTSVKKDDNKFSFPV